MRSFSEVVDSLRRHSESIPISDIWTFMSLHNWLLHHGYIRSDAAVIIVLEGASYVVYPDFPYTTLVVQSQGTLQKEDFAFIRRAELYGEYLPPYTFGAFLLELLHENKVAFLIIAVLAGLTVWALNSIDLLVDKSIDVAAIAAAFLTLFLSFKSEPKRSDQLWFRRGEYGKHFRVDRYSLRLTAFSLVIFLSLMIAQAILDDSLTGKFMVFVMLSTGWFSLYAGFQLIMTYHIDRLETDGAKQLADNLRESIKRLGQQHRDD